MAAASLRSDWISSAEESCHQQGQRQRAREQRTILAVLLRIVEVLPICLVVGSEELPGRSRQHARTRRKAQRTHGRR